MGNWTVNSIISGSSNYLKILSKSLAVVLLSLAVLTVNAGGRQSIAATGKIEPLPRDLEIQLALSALPPYLRDKATVYTLNPEKGFEVAREGTNGFHTLVGRTDEAAFRDASAIAEFRDDILIPISYDEAGAKAQMQVVFDVAEMQAKGVSFAEIKKTIGDRYRTEFYKAPERVGVSYMLSPVMRTYVNPDESDRITTINMPHVMYYAPNVSNEDIGGKPESMYPFIISRGPHGYIVQSFGRAEAEAITNEYTEMLGQLCKIKADWCLPK